MIVALLSVAGILLAWFLIEKTQRRTHPVTGGRDTTRTIAHTQEFELYSNSFSHCSRKVRLAMAELDIDVLHHPIDLIETGWYQTLSPAYLQINPAGLVPTLVHNGHPVYESDDILEYAQQTSATHQQLVPDDPTELSKMRGWLEFGSISSADPMAEMERNAGACIPGLSLPLFTFAIAKIPLAKILVGFLFHPDKARPAFFSLAKLLGPERTLSIKPIRKMVSDARKAMPRHLVRLNDELSEKGGDWLMGQQFTLADISIGSLLFRLEETGWLQSFAQQHDLTALLAYYERIQSRPAWPEAISAHSHPIIDSATGELAGSWERLGFD